MAGERAVVTAADHATALSLVTDWAERAGVVEHTTGQLLELVGLIAATRADAREEGRRAGLQSAADRLRLWASTLEGVL